MNIFFIILSIIYLIFIINYVRMGNFSVSESFFWVIAGLIILFLSIFPDIIIILANFIGVDYAPSLLFVMCIMFLGMLIFRNSKRITVLKEQVYTLAQEVSILKKDNNKK